jgi:hypothetical protein
MVYSKYLLNKNPEHIWVSYLLYQERLKQSIFIIMKSVKFLFAGFIALLTVGFSYAQASVNVGSAPMYPTKNTIQMGCHGGSVWAMIKGDKIMIQRRKREIQPR